MTTGFRLVWMSLFSLTVMLGLGCAHAQAPASSPDPSASPDRSASPSTLRLLSYNIHHGEGGDGKIDLQRLANIIKASNPDLVALQEVDVNTTRSNNVDQAATLGELTGLHVYFAPAMDYQGGKYGGAILSRFPIDKSGAVALLRGNSEPRVALSVLVKTPDGQPLVFTSTHLDHKTPEQRMEQAKVILEKVPAWAASVAPQGAAMVLAGDLNATPEEPVIKELARVWTDLDPEQAPTYPDEQLKIDYLLVHPARAFKFVSLQVLKEVTLADTTLKTDIASDHYPVLLIVQRKQAAASADNPAPAPSPDQHKN